MLINIHEFVSFDNDKWLMYQVPDINFHTDTKTTNSAYCYAEHGRLNIFDSSTRMELLQQEYRVRARFEKLQRGISTQPVFC